jgi:hypothetical protein
MSSARKKSFKRSWDSFFCFHISDFRSGDSLIVSVNRHNRVRGRVDSVDERQKLILYRTAENELRSAELNDIVYLDDYKRNWLDQS